ncbi:hypothetical protein C4D60_Mb02t00920 [Musa balbisiana]|uniref:Uncharacterized protein n=1 Tax=Musa balbisiana TaxID=52838 RepID=A0A4S8I885_MUSBA|nr:hypothetical protein C4D60_Mb02t00920 [Musa balbisiana]
MSKLWEEAIQKWYTDSHTSHLDYLNLAETTKPTRKELAHNISVIYDRTCLSSRRIKKLESSVKILSSLFSESKPLTQSDVQKLVLEISKQPKLIEEEALRLSQDLNQKLQRVEILLSKIKR